MSSNNGKGREACLLDDVFRSHSTLSDSEGGLTSYIKAWPKTRYPTSLQPLMRQRDTLTLQPYNPTAHKLNPLTQNPEVSKPCLSSKLPLKPKPSTLKPHLSHCTYLRRSSNAEHSNREIIRQEADDDEQGSRYWCRCCNCPHYYSSFSSCYCWCCCSYH